MNMNQQQQQPMITVVPMPNQQVNKAPPNTKHKNSVKWLAIVELFLSAFVFFGGIAEMAMAGNSCRDENDIYDYRCLISEFAIGQGIWGAIFPFVAAAVGIVCSSKPVSQKKFGALIAFSIIGACSMGIVCTIELSVLSYPRTPFNKLQIVLASVAAFNTILLIVSASFGCYFGCCCQGVNQHQQVVYVAYNPAGGAPIQFASAGMAMNPQMMVATPQPVAFAPQQNQMLFTQQQIFALHQQQQYQEQQQQQQQHQQPAPSTSAPPRYEPTEVKTALQ